MTTPNTTGAQALSDERIKQLWVEHGLDECDPEGFARVIEAEVLSALAGREKAGAVAQPSAAPGDGQRDALMKLSQFAHTATHMSESDMRNNLSSIADELIALATAKEVIHG